MRKDKNLTPINHAVASDYAIAGCFLLVHVEVGTPVGFETVQLKKAAWVKEQIDPFTSSQFALVVVGNSRLLGRDVHWRSMLDHYQAEGCFVQVILSNYIRGE